MKSLNYKELKEFIERKKIVNIFISEVSWDAQNDFGSRKCYIQLEDEEFIPLIPQYEDDQFEVLNCLPKPELFRRVECVDDIMILNRVVVDILISDCFYSFGLVLEIDDYNKLVLCLDDQF